MILHGFDMDGILIKITEEAAKRGYDVRIRDIAYAILKKVLCDSKIAYTVVFGMPAKENDIPDYESLDLAKFLAEWFVNYFANPQTEEKTEDVINSILKKNQQTDDEVSSMSFADNRAGIEAQIEEILNLKKQLIGPDGNCTDVKTMALLQKTEMDARSRLNDKFGASEKNQNQFIIVNPKYDYICPWTRHECYQMTKERAMAMWNLIEKKDDGTDAS